MKINNINKPFFRISGLKLVAFALFFVVLTSSFLQANTVSNPTIEKLSSSQINSTNFIITAAFISTWEIKEIRDHAVLEVLSTSDFFEAQSVIEELRKIIDEPILVDHGYENNKVVYTIIVGRFTDVEEAISYHNMFK